MKSRHYLLLLVLALFAHSADAQQFLNGSMEPRGTITTCSDALKTGYNANMGNVWEASELSKIYLADNTCGIGTAADGSYFTVLKYRVPLGNLLTFKLSSNLVVGQTYKVAYKFKTIVGASSLGGFRFGYCKDSVSFDSTCGYRNGMVNTAWNNDTLTFTPKQAWKFFWIEVITLQGAPYDLHLDDFRMFSVAAPTSVVAAGLENAIHVFPNPLRSSTTITIDKGVSLPCNMQLVDLSGKQLLRQELTERTTGIDKSGLASGMYFIKITGNDGLDYTTKVFVE